VCEHGVCCCWVGWVGGLKPPNKIRAKKGRATVGGGFFFVKTHFYKKRTSIEKEEFDIKIQSKNNLAKKFKISLRRYRNIQKKLHTLKMFANLAVFFHFYFSSNCGK
jgi:hypothetical protein